MKSCGITRSCTGATSATSTDESEVVTADISGDGMLNLRVFFPSLKQTREYGLMMQPDGTMRAIYNRNQKQRIHHQGRQIHRQRKPYSAAA